MAKHAARCVALASLLATLAWAAVGSADAALAPPGWVQDGSPWTPQPDQLRSDAGTNACTSNAALLFRVRGSGARYGSGERTGEDPLGRWAIAAGEALIDKGWSVRDAQAVYDAPPVPPWSQIAGYFTAALHASPLGLPAALLRGARRTVRALRAYRAVATREWPQVRNQLAQDAARCRTRRIVVAGYSQGGILLRQVLTHLDGATQQQIAGVDLVADPTADAHADTHIPHAQSGLRRLTHAGIDTFASGVLRLGRFRQVAYPPAIAARTVTYCEPYDLVCDANLVSFARARGEGARHAAYPWAAIGAAAARGLRAWPLPSVSRALADLPEQGGRLGSPTAALVLHDFMDFQCPFCREYVDTSLATLIASYVRAGQLQLVLNPVSFIGPDSVTAAHYAEAAGLQNLLWPFAVRFYLRQGEENSGYVTGSFLRATVTAVPGLDFDAVRAAARSPAVDTALTRSRELWTRFRLTGVPSFALGRSGGPLRVVAITRFGASDLSAPIERLLHARG